jgi:hypothetical protein
LVAQLRRFGTFVEEEVRANVVPKLPFQPDPGLPARIGRLARELMISYLPLYRRLCPLELCMSVICDEFSLMHRSLITAGRFLFGKRSAISDFQRITDESYGYALCFFERRQAGLEEVREIALIGE